MRKHFLLLFLLTLLPFTAWADDISNVRLATTLPTVYTTSGVQLNAISFTKESNDVPVQEGELQLTLQRLNNYDDQNQPEDWTEAQGTLVIGDAGWYKLTVEGDESTVTSWAQDDRMTSDGVYVFFVAKANADVTAPIAIEGLTYNGDPQNLFAVGNTNAGTLSYFVSSSNETPDPQELGWINSAQNGQRSDAGTYYLYYKLDGGNNYNSVSPTSFGPVEIAMADATFTAPEAIDDLSYTGIAQNLFTGGSTTEGTLSYAVTASDVASIAADAEDTWYAAEANELKRTDAGNYKLWYKLTGDNNHNDVAPTSFGTVNIEGANTNACTVQPGQIAGKTYDGNAVNLTINKGTFTYGTANAVIKFATSATAPADQWTTEAPKDFNNLDLEGKWYYKSVVEETTSYPAAESEVKSFVISPVTITYFITGTTYNVGDVLDVKNHYSKASGDFVDNQTLANYAQFQFYTTGSQSIPVDANKHLTTKGSYEISALRVVWNTENTPHNYDFRFTSSGKIIVAAKSIENFVAGAITGGPWTFDGSQKTPVAPALYPTQEDADAGTNALVLGTDYTVSYGANVNAGTTAGQIIYTANDDKDCNYDGTKTIYFEIQKANLVKGTDFTVPTAKEKLSYTAAAKDLIDAVTIGKDVTDNVKGTFWYKLGNGDWSTDIPQATNAGDYNLLWKIIGGTNYNDYSEDAVAPATVPTTEFAIENVKIAKAKLVVQPDKEVVKALYTGAAPTLNVAVSYTKFYGDDNADNVFSVKPTISLANAVETAQYAKGEYEDGVVVSAGTLSSTNYEVYPVNSKLEITAANVKVKLKGGSGRWQQSANFGPAADALTSWELKVADKAVLTVVQQTGYDAQNNPVYTTLSGSELVDNVVNADDVLKVKTVGTSTEAVDWFDGLTITRAAGTAVGKYTVTLSGCQPKNDNFVVFDQTVATEAEESPANPDVDFAPYFYITAQNVTVKAANKSKVYGTATEPKLTLTVTEGALSTAQKTLLESTLERGEGENVDVYDITFTKQVDGVTYDENGNPEIEGLNINYQVGAFAITPKTLTIAALPQTLYTTNTEANLKTGKDVAYTVTGLVDGDDEPVVKVEFADFVEVDNDKKLVITTANPAPAFVEYKHDNAQGAPYDKPGLAVKVTNLDAFAQNYEVVLDSAVLKVVNVETTIILSKINDNTSAIEAAKTKTVNIVFADEDIVIKKEKWYTMVLPFNTSVQEFSSVFGYAVVDTLNENNNTKNIQFRLHMQDLPANKPFIFKIFKDKNLKDVDFGAKTIVYAEDLADNEVCGKDVFGNKYIGTYAGKTGFTAYEWRMTTDATLNSDGSYKYDKWYYGGAGSENKTIAPLAAYVLSVEPGGTAHFNAPIITIEDLGEDGTTVIKQLNEETMDAYNVDGWYTLDGIKLQNMPTQKGIYINNGKKVVVK